MNDCQDTLPNIVIRPSKGLNTLKLNELWEYRELFYFLALRNIQVRYKQTVIGIAWAILQPVATMFVFTIFFGRLAGMPSDGMPYPIFALSGLLPWIFFSNAVSASTDSMVTDANLVKKIYFPRIIIPTASIFSALLDLMLGFILILILLPFFDMGYSYRLFLFPLLGLLLFITTTGIGISLATMNALFRDIRHVMPFALQIWLFITPIVYPMSLLSEKWKAVYSLNPMVGVVETFKWMILGTDLNLMSLITSIGISSILFVFGIFFFRKMEPTFADVI